MTLIQSGSIILGALLLEAGLALRTVILLFAVVQILSGLVWIVVVAPAERQEESGE